MTFQPSCLTSLQQYGYHQSLSLFLSSMSVVSFPSLLLSSSLFHSIFQLSAQPDGYVFHGSTSPSLSITYTQTQTHIAIYIYTVKKKIKSSPGYSRYLMHRRRKKNTRQTINKVTRIVLFPLKSFGIS